jgi:hypothetical protein
MINPVDYIRSFFGPDYYEVIQDVPLILAVPVTPTGVLGNASYKWVLSYLIKVRDMGAATFIGVGNVDGQDWKLTTKGETTGWSGNPKEVADLSRVYIVADGAGAIVEVIAAYIPTPLQGSVAVSDRGLM